MTEALASVLEWIAANPGISIPAFILIFTAVMAVGIPGGFFLLLSGGFLVGWLPGAVYCTLGAGLAAYVTFLTIQSVFGRWLDARAGRLKSLMASFIDDGHSLLLLLPRVIPGIPFFALNISLAASGVPLPTYLWTTLLGTFPVALLFCRVGSEFRRLEELSEAGLLSILASPGMLVPLALLVTMVLLGWWLTRRRAIKLEEA